MNGCMGRLRHKAAALLLGALFLLPLNVSLAASGDVDWVAWRVSIVRDGPQKDTFDRLEQYLKQNPNNANAHLLMGLCYEKLGYTNYAKAEFVHAGKLDPALTQSVINEMRSAIAKGDSRTVFDYASFVRAIAPLDPVVLYARAMVERRSGNYDSAVVHFEQAFNGGLVCPGVATQLASLYYLHDDYDKALRLVDRDLKLNPNLSDAHHYRGIILLSMHRPGEAVDSLKKVYEESATDGDLLARALVEAGRPEEAIQPCLVAVAMEDKDAAKLKQHKVLLAEIFEKTTGKQQERSIKIASARLKGSRYQPRLFFSVADVYDQMHDPANAITVRAAGIDVDPAYTRGYYRMAQSYDVFGDYASAVAFYAKAHSMDPTNEKYLALAKRAQERIGNRTNDIAWQLRDWLQDTMHPVAKPTVWIRGDKSLSK